MHIDSWIVFILCSLESCFLLWLILRKSTFKSLTKEISSSESIADVPVSEDVPAAPLSPPPFEGRVDIVAHPHFPLEYYVTYHSHGKVKKVKLSLPESTKPEDVEHHIRTHDESKF